MKPQSGGRWRGQVSTAAAREIFAAFDQLEADWKYDQHAPKALETLKNLENAASLANHLATLIDRLSPIAKAAIYECPGLHVVGRYELNQLSRNLRALQVSSEKARDELRTRHQPFSDGGQGAKSSLGREPDAWAIVALTARTAAWIRSDRLKTSSASAYLRCWRSITPTVSRSMAMGRLITYKRS